MRVVDVATIALVAGCGRLGFGDPTGDARGVPDSGEGLGGFGPPVLVIEVSLAGEEDEPTLTADQLELYFETSRAGGQGGADIWFTSRTSTSVPWASPVPVVELNTAGNDMSPRVSGDGLTMYVASNRAGNIDIFFSTRGSRIAAWSNPVRIPELSSLAEDQSPTRTTSELEAIFHSLRAGGAGGRDIYLSTRATTASAWGAPQPVSSINTPVDDADPCFGDDLVVAFASAAGSIGMRDLFETSRGSIGAPFGAATAIEGVNTADDETSPWLSPDGRTLYFASDRSGLGDIYVATR